MMSETPQVLAAVLAGKPGYQPDRVGLLYTADNNPGYFVPPTSMSELETLSVDLVANIAVSRFPVPPAIPTDDPSSVKFSGATPYVYEHVFTPGAPYAESLDTLDAGATDATLLGLVLLSKPGQVYLPVAFQSLRNESGVYPVRQAGTDHFFTISFNIGS